MHTTCINDLDHERYFWQVYHRKRGLAVTCLSDINLGHQLHSAVVTLNLLLCVCYGPHNENFKIDRTGRCV